LRAEEKQGKLKNNIKPGQEKQVKKVNFEDIKKQ
jgi:hypothetical protein